MSRHSYRAEKGGEVEGVLQGGPSLMRRSSKKQRTVGCLLVPTWNYPHREMQHSGRSPKVAGAQQKYDCLKKDAAPGNTRKAEPSTELGNRSNEVLWRVKKTKNSKRRRKQTKYSENIMATINKQTKLGSSLQRHSDRGRQSESQRASGYLQGRFQDRRREV